MNTNPLRVATFDCYGTLVDWEGGAATFLYDLALRQGEPTLQPGRLLRSRWEALQFELIQGRYRPYKEVLAESLRALTVPARADGVVPSTLLRPGQPRAAAWYTLTGSPEMRSDRSSPARPKGQASQMCSFQRVCPTLISTTRLRAEWLERLAHRGEEGITLREQRRPGLSSS